MAIIPGFSFVAGITSRFAGASSGHGTDWPAVLIRVWADGAVVLSLEVAVVSTTFETEDGTTTITASSWRVRLLARVNGTLQEVYSEDDLYPDPLIGVSFPAIDGLGIPERSTWPLDRWAVAFRASSIDTDLPGYLDDGLLVVTHNEVEIFSDSSVALRLLAYFLNNEIQIGTHADRDRDNLWLGAGTTLPGAFDGDGMPTDLETPVGAWTFSDGIPEDWTPWDWTVGGTEEEGGGPGGNGLFPFENETAGVDGSPALSITSYAPDDSGPGDDTNYRLRASLWSPLIPFTESGSPGSPGSPASPGGSENPTDGEIGPIAWVEEWEDDD